MKKTTYFLNFGEHPYKKNDNTIICPHCNGDGWTSEHANHPHPDGDCLGECPIQEQCAHCQGTGKVTKEIFDNYNTKQTEIEIDDLPF
jgi:DnaJ-class molecular chaperone